RNRTARPGHPRQQELGAFPCRLRADRGGRSGLHGPGSNAIGSRRAALDTPRRRNASLARRACISESEELSSTPQCLHLTSTAQGESTMLNSQCFHGPIPRRSRRLSAVASGLLAAGLLAGTSLVQPAAAQEKTITAVMHSGLRVLDPIITTAHITP